MNLQAHLEEFKVKSIENNRQDEQDANHNDLVGSTNSRHIESIRQHAENQNPQRNHQINDPNLPAY